MAPAKGKRKGAGSRGGRGGNSGRGRSQATPGRTLADENAELRRQLQQLQDNLASRQVISDHITPAHSSAPVSTEPIVTRSTRRGRKRTSTNAQLDGRISNSNSSGDVPNSNSAQVDSDLFMEVPDVASTVTFSDNPRNQVNVPSTSNESMQQQISNIRSMIQSLAEKQSSTSTSCSQSNNAPSTSVDANDSSQAFLQQQLDELKALVASLVDQQQGSSSSTQRMQVDDVTISQSIKEAICEEKDTGDHYVEFMYAGATLDSKIKQKIWSTKYVDLATLRPKSESKSSPNDNQNGASSQNSKQPTSWSEWFRLFVTYASIYLKQFPEECSGVLTYMLRIHNLARKDPQSFVWRDYDEQFRNIKGLANDIPWHIVNQHILSQVKDDALSGKSTFRKPVTNKFEQNPNAFKLGTCFDFNDNKKFCNRKTCKYAHRCSKCNGTHPQYMCGKSSFNTNPRSSDNGSGKSVGKK